MGACQHTCFSVSCHPIESTKGMLCFNIIKKERRAGKVTENLNILFSYSDVILSPVT